jgi:hypothetical protein
LGIWQLMEQRDLSCGAKVQLHVSPSCTTVEG